MPQVHEREFKVRAAKRAFDKFVIDLCEEAELTEIELLQIFTESQQSTLKYMLRAERHPESPDKPAGLA